MALMLTAPLPVVGTIAEAQADMAALVEADAVVGPRFYTLAAGLTIAVLLDGTVREAEVIAPRGYPELVII